VHSILSTKQKEASSESTISLLGGHSNTGIMEPILSKHITTLNTFIRWQRIQVSMFRHLNPDENRRCLANQDIVNKILPYLGSLVPINQSNCDQKVNDSIRKFERNLQVFAASNHAINFYAAMDFVESLKGHSPPNITKDHEFYDSYINRALRTPISQHLLVQLCADFLVADLANKMFSEDIERVIARSPIPQSR
jgi:hypothetical protein